MKGGRGFRIALVVFVAALIVALLIFSGAQQKRAGVTSYGSSPSGLSVFYELGQDVSPGVLQRMTRAVLSEDELASLDYFLLLAPIAPISKREAELIRTAVLQGTFLVMSFHTREQHARLAPVFSALETTVRLEPVQDFENGVPEQVIAKADSALLEANRPYFFYSRFKLGGSRCRRSRIECFYQEFELPEGGKFAVVAGVPPLANGLIGRGANRRIAYQMLQSDQVKLDEYHHLFAETSLGELLTFPEFILPIVGMIIGIILFFLFGYTPLRFEESGVAPAAFGPSHHDLYLGIVSGVLGQHEGARDGLEFHRKILARLHPEVNVDRSDELRSASELISKHQALLKERGYRPLSRVVQGDS